MTNFLVNVLIVVYVTLWAKLGYMGVWDTYGPEAFKNPGGWRLPRGEVISFGYALAGLFSLVALDLLIHGR